MKEDFEQAVEKELKKKSTITEEEMIKAFEKILDTDFNRWVKTDSKEKSVTLKMKSLEKKYLALFTQAINDVFEKLPLSGNHRRKLRAIAVNLFFKFPKDVFHNNVSGVVVAGFGEDEIFPGIKSFLIEGIANNRLNYKIDVTDKIDYNQSAMIMPFAQRDMVNTFIEGVAPLYNRVFHQLLSKTVQNYPDILVDTVLKGKKEKEKEQVRKKLKEIGLESLKEGLKKLQRLQYEEYIEPVLKVVTYLPKNELAAMAESLVNLTCLRKKISMDEETVGGPIDVAVISKGDGLIWIKRKHYFDPNLNNQFFANYLK